MQWDDIIKRTTDKPQMVENNVKTMMELWHSCWFLNEQQQNKNKKYFCKRDSKIGGCFSFRWEYDTLNIKDFIVQLGLARMEPCLPPVSTHIWYILPVWDLGRLNEKLIKSFWHYHIWWLSVSPTSKNFTCFTFGDNIKKTMKVKKVKGLHKLLSPTENTVA